MLQLQAPRTMNNLPLYRHSRTPSAVSTRRALTRLVHSAICLLSGRPPASSMSSSSSIATCSSTTLSALLTDQYINQCSTDSGYQFTAATVPTQDVIDLMCASSACRSLLADAQAMDLSECILPVGDNIRLLADLIDYVPPRCPSASGSAAAGSTTTDSTVTASSTSGNTTSSSDTVTAPSSSSLGETSTTATSSPSTQTSASAAASASASASSSGSSAASPVGRALSVMTLGALAIVTYIL